MQVTSWGLFPKTETSLISTDRTGSVYDLIRNKAGLIARGNGRSYGDSALHDCVFSTLKLNRFLAFDKTNGTITCEAGVLLDEVISLIVPAGFFLPVIPGTRFITIGGAIASDVHGKNHAQSGCFSRHLISFELLTGSGEIQSCSKTENEILFHQTCGGMGLTGIILRATIQLEKIETAFIRQRTIKTKSLNETLQAFEKNADSPYSVAWIDCISSGEKSGRGVLTIGEHASATDLAGKKKALLAVHSKPGINIPFFFPSFVLNPLSIALFNRFTYFKAKNNEEKIVHYAPFFFPLDAIENWNRIYGRKGFLQYQFVIPFEHAAAGLNEILNTIRSSKQKPFLSVLKIFGEADPGFPMSFPMHGYSLAMDFKMNAGLFPMMDRLDEIVLKYKGRLYLTKDARMKPAAFHQMYAANSHDPLFQSQQSQRLEW